MRFIEFESNFNNTNLSEGRYNINIIIKKIYYFPIYKNVPP